jgi:hypothetical protein
MFFDGCFTERLERIIKQLTDKSKVQGIEEEDQVFAFVISQFKVLK